MELMSQFKCTYIHITINICQFGKNSSQKLSSCSVVTKDFLKHSLLECFEDVCLMSITSINDYISIRFILTDHKMPKKLKYTSSVLT